MHKNRIILLIILIFVANIDEFHSQELKIDPMYRIQLLVQMGKYESAIEFTEKLHDSLNCKKLEILGFCYRNLNNNLKSITYYEEYVEKCEPSYIQRVNFGDSYYKINQLDKAKEQFLIAKKLNPELGLIDYNLGLIEYDNGEKEKAVEYFTSAINKTKGKTLDFDYVEMQIQTLNELEKYELALKNIDIVLELWNYNSNGYKYTQILKSSIFGAKGDYQKALKLLNETIESGIENQIVLLEAYYHQIDFYSEINDRDKVCDIYEKIKELKPDSGYLEKYKCD